MDHLDINKLHRDGALLEGAMTTMGGSRAGLPKGQEKNALVAGVGVLIWRGRHKIEWVQQPIIVRNPPPSWGANVERWRPKFLCPGCGRGAYLLCPWGESFGCRACSGVERPSRVDRDPVVGDMHRVDKLQRKLRVKETGVFADLPRPPRAPRSRWLYDRRVMVLRLMELRALGLPLEDFLSRSSAARQAELSGVSSVRGSVRLA